MTRCPTCDLEIAYPSSIDDDIDDELFCIRYKSHCQSDFPVDWRTRALKAEWEVERMRAIVAAAVAWRKFGRDDSDDEHALLTAIDAAKESKHG